MADQGGTKPFNGGPPALKLRTHTIRVEVVHGVDEGTVVELPGPEARIGTGADCDLVLKDPTVSRNHLTLRIQNDFLRVIDSGSRNGTFIDGTKIHDAYARPDSIIKIGGTTLRIRMLSAVIEVPLSNRDRFGGLIGQSVAMRRLFAQLERFAPTDQVILIEGETGTGKELAAKSIHEASARAGGPFVVFDCASILPAAIEGQLFGQIRGAYPGATNRTGCFQQADGGTLFLDEIGALPLEVQRRLLDAIKSKSIQRIGEDASRPVNVRVLVANSRSLAYEVEKGRFREDVYYQIAPVTIRMPSLRERPDDIPLLIGHFEQEYASIARPLTPLPESVVQDFVGRAWLGNVRELKKQVELALLILGGGGPPPAEGEMSPPPGPKVSGVSLDIPLLVARELVVDAFEREYIELVLEKANDNISRAAEIAGVGRRFIQRSMRRLGLRGRGNDRS